MRELPILFSTEMVRAILDGRKTMTRRVIKIDDAPENWRKSIAGTSIVRTSPYDAKLSRYAPGDILWVRETWKVEGIDPANFTMLIRYKADDECKVVQFTQERYEKFRKFYQKNGWQSPYFMPKEAARIWLEVTDVRVERLQVITEKDAIKEGVRVGIGGMPYFSCQDAFPALWDSTIKNQDLPLYGWDSNCWVWIYEFKRLEVRP
jgi:hypothetical protein